MGSVCLGPLRHEAVSEESLIVHPYSSRNRNAAFSTLYGVNRLPFGIRMQNAPAILICPGNPFGVRGVYMGRHHAVNHKFPDSKPDRATG